MADMNRTAEHVEWNFGDADEEAEAFSSGQSTKVAKVSRKTQRLTLVNFKDMSREERQKLLFPFLGHVSTIKGPSSHLICNMFGCDFYIHAPPSVSPTTSIVLPAWIAGTTNKSAQATMFEYSHDFKCVTCF